MNFAQLDRLASTSATWPLAAAFHIDVSLWVPKFSHHLPGTLLVGHSWPIAWPDLAHRQHQAFWFMLSDVCMLVCTGHKMIVTTARSPNSMNQFLGHQQSLMATSLYWGD